MTDRTMDETHRQEHGQASTILDRPDIAKPFVIGAYTIMLAAAAVPLAIAEYPALTDYINHLARMYILVNYDGSAILPTVYQIQWKFIPNLAMDLVVPGIAPLNQDSAQRCVSVAFSPASAVVRTSQAASVSVVMRAIAAYCRDFRACRRQLLLESQAFCSVEHL